VENESAFQVKEAAANLLYDHCDLSKIYICLDNEPHYNFLRQTAGDIEVQFRPFLLRYDLLLSPEENERASWTNELWNQIVLSSNKQ